MQCEGLLINEVNNIIKEVGGNLISFINYNICIIIYDAVRNLEFIHSELLEVILVLHWLVLLWIPHVLVDLVLELGVVLPLGGVLVHHWHVWVDHDLSVLLNGSDLRVQLLKVLGFLEVVLVQSVVDLVPSLQVLHVLF